MHYRREVLGITTGRYHNLSSLPGRCGTNRSIDIGVRSKEPACKSTFRQWYNLTEPTLEECVQHCIVCRECRFATFSRSLRDCSLYRACSVEHLASGYGYRTVAVTKEKLSVEMRTHAAAHGGEPLFALDFHEPSSPNERSPVVVKPNAALLADDVRCNIFGRTDTGRLATREDLILNRTAKLEFGDGKCGLAYRFDSNYTWVHVPKCGSSWLRATFHIPQKSLTDTEKASSWSRRSKSTSFAISRDPTQRLVSSFYTVMERASTSKCWRNALPFVNETHRDRQFLGMLGMMRDTGPRIDDLAACPEVRPCVWHHPWSQSLFLFRGTGLPPLRRDHVIGLDRLSTELPAALDSGTVRALQPRAYNAIFNARASAEPDKAAQLLRLPGVLQFAAEYFKQDYACLGYKLPDLAGLRPTMWAI